MNSRWLLISTGVALAALSGVGCSESSSSEPVTAAGGSAGSAGTAGTAGGAGDSGTPDQSVETGPEAEVPDVAEDPQDTSTPETAPAEVGADVVEEPLPTEKICAEYEPGFNEANPGLAFTFDFGTSVLMGKEMGLGAGSFMTTAREDFCKPSKGLEVPIDTCTDVAAPGVSPQCATKDDCGPEQECEPETNNGQPIPGTEHCVTPRSPLDVGQFTLSGFVSGPKTFHYNSQQKGAYTATDSADGQIPPADFGYDVDYVFGGMLDADAGLGALTGTFHFPKSFAWVAPALVDLPNMPGVTGIEVPVGKDLALQWTGGAPDAVLSMTMTGGPKLGGKTITCRAKNDGSFVIPAAFVEAVKLSDLAFVNVLEIRMESKIPQITGPGITMSKVSTLQTRVLNLIKK